MKNTLGKILLLLLASLSLIADELAEYSLTANKMTPYVKEAVEISFRAHQTDRSDVMFFFLTPKESDAYKIVLLQKEAKEIDYHEKETTFTYLLFPLKSGEIDVDFNFVIKVASDAAVAQVYTGSRDNVKWIETDDTQIQLTPLRLNVKGLSQSVDLVGDFTLASKLEKNSANAYENINIKYFLKGIGFDDFSIEPLGKIAGVDIFKDVVKHRNRATKDGYKIQREFNYALISPKSFTIPAQEIACFSPLQNRYYTLKTKEYKIAIKELPKSELLDKEEYPKKEDYSEGFKNFMVYLLIFIAGYITAKIDLPLRLQNRSKYKDIKESSSAKELLYTLMHSYSDKKLEHFYNPLEDIVYKKSSKKSFSKIKREILKTLQSS